MKSCKFVLAVSLVASLCLIGVADATDSVTINATVPAYVEVSFGTADHGTLQVLPPSSGTVYGQNTTSIPINVTANCGFKLDLYENLPYVIQQLIGAADFTPFWGGTTGGGGEFVWATYMKVVPESARTTPDGPAFNLGGIPFELVAIPSGVGSGLHSHLEFAYGASMAYSGGALIHDGQFTMYAIVGVATTDATVSGHRWTDLQAGSTPTFTVYAQISTL